MFHHLSGYSICKDNFFKNPQKIINLSKNQTYYKLPEYPGKRTSNLLESEDVLTKNFAKFLASKIAIDIFPGIHSFLMDIRFHINETYDIEEANYGWIHSDEAQLAGIIYLNDNDIDFMTGTSIFDKKTSEDFLVQDIRSRINFNLNDSVSSQYLEDLKNNHQNFIETIKFGNKFNRIVAYDAQMYHRPNYYKMSNNEPRKTIVFFIDQYKYKESSINVTHFWNDQ